MLCAVLAGTVAIIAGCSTSSDRRNASFTGGDFVLAGSEDSPYMLESGPGQASFRISAETGAQSFRSSTEPTALSEISLTIDNHVDGISSDANYSVSLHRSVSGQPGSRVSIIGTGTVPASFTGPLRVAPAKLVTLTPDTEYFVILTPEPGGADYLTWRTTVNTPITNVNPQPSFTALSSTDGGTNGSWLPLETGRNFMMRISVVADTAVPTTTTTPAGGADITAGTDPITAGPEPSTTTSSSIPADEGAGGELISSVTTVPGTSPDTAPAGTTQTVATIDQGTPSTSDPAPTVPGSGNNGTTATSPVQDTVAPAGPGGAQTAAPEDDNTDSGDTHERSVYSPALDPKRTSDITVTVAALASLTLAGGAAVALGGAVPNGTGNSGTGDPVRLSTLATKRLRRRTRSETSRGDRSRSWRWPGTDLTDIVFSRWAARTAPFSQIAPRLLVDGSWLRAILGSFGLLPFVLGALGAVAWAIDTNGSAGLPDTWILALVLTCAVLDAAAGLAAFAVILAGTFLGGGMNDLADCRLMLGLGVVLLSTSLVAHVIRPLRRVVVDGGTLLERALDYLMAPVGTLFAMEAMTRMLDGLAGRPVVDSAQLTTVRTVVVLALVVRLAGEDLSVHAYPERTGLVQPAQMGTQTNLWACVASAVRFCLYLFVAAPFFGLGWATWVTAGLLTLPFLLDVLGDRFRKFDPVGNWLPRGYLRFFLLLVLGSWLSAVLLGEAPSAESVRDTLPWLFVPSAVVAVLQQFADTSRAWPHRTVKYAGGAVLWVCGVLILAGVISF